MVRSARPSDKGSRNVTNKTPQRSVARKARPDLSGWLTRWQASEALGVTENTVINWGRRGLVTPVRALKPDRGGVERVQWLYDPKELTKVPRAHRLVQRARTEGETAARCFELLNAGKSIREIVIELREEPSKIEDLREKWLDYGAADLVINDVAREALEKVVGPFQRVAELIALVRELAPKAVSG